MQPTSVGELKAERASIVELVINIETFTIFMSSVRWMEPKPMGVSFILMHEHDGENLVKTKSTPLLLSQMLFWPLKHNKTSLVLL